MIEEINMPSDNKRRNLVMEKSFIHINPGPKTAPPLSDANSSSNTAPSVQPQLSESDEPSNMAANSADSSSMSGNT